MRLLKRNDAEFQKFRETILPTLNSWSDVMAWGEKNCVPFTHDAMNAIRNRLCRMTVRKQRRLAHAVNELVKCLKVVGLAPLAGLRSEPAGIHEKGNDIWTTSC